MNADLPVSPSPFVRGFFHLRGAGWRHVYLETRPVRMSSDVFISERSGYAWEKVIVHSKDEDYVPMLVIRG